MADLCDAVSEAGVLLWLDVAELTLVVSGGINALGSVAVLTEVVGFSSSKISGSSEDPGMSSLGFFCVCQAAFRDPELNSGEL